MLTMLLDKFKTENSVLLSCLDYSPEGDKQFSPVSYFIKLILLARVFCFGQEGRGGLHGNFLKIDFLVVSNRGELLTLLLCWAS